MGTETEHISVDEWRYYYRQHGLIKQPEKRSKYRNERVEVDGHKFASKREAERYRQLRVMERLGEISHLQVQARFDLIVNQSKVCSYVADFAYLNSESKTVIEDCKGWKSQKSLPYRHFLLKKKLMKALYQIEIQEV